jgi:ubiquitin C-terminal hydrolase
MRIIKKTFILFLSTIVFEEVSCFSSFGSSTITFPLNSPPPSDDSLPPSNEKYVNTTNSRVLPRQLDKDVINSFNGSNSEETAYIQALQKSKKEAELRQKENNIYTDNIRLAKRMSLQPKISEKSPEIKNSNGKAVSNLSEEEQIAIAIAMSLQPETTGESEIKSKLQQNEGKSFDDNFRRTITKLLPSEIRWKPQATVYGLPNAGNTCYVNATLQALYACGIFDHVAIIDNIQLPNEGDPNYYDICFLKMIRRTFNEMTKRTIKLEDMKDIIQVLAHSMINHYSGIDTKNHIVQNILMDMRAVPEKGSVNQHDVAELLELLLDYTIDICQKLHIDEENEKSLPNEAENKFCFSGAIIGEQTYSTSCTKCLTSFFRRDPFRILSLPIHGQKSLSGCIRAYQDEEVLGEKNKYNCSECSKGDKELYTIARKKIVLFPSDILVIQLERFANHQEQNEDSVQNKLMDAIECQQTLRIREHDYELKAVINHIGHSIKSGHFTASALAPNGMWYYVDDSTISKLQPSMNFENAYVLFYKRKTNP